MTRPRLPAWYGTFQFCMRLVVFVVEICALAALVTLSKYGTTWPLGYVASCLGLVFEMVEMVVLANSSHYIKRVPSCGLVFADFVLFALGLISFCMFSFKDGWTKPRNEYEYFDHIHDPYRVEKDMWSPWYIWLQLAAAVLHFFYMIMHCIDACRR